MIIVVTPFLPLSEMIIIANGITWVIANNYKNELNIQLFIGHCEVISLKLPRALKSLRGRY